MPRVYFLKVSSSAKMHGAQNFLLVGLVEETEAFLQSGELVITEI